MTEIDSYGDRHEFEPIRSHCMCAACKGGTIHASDCAVHNAPALPVGDCDCGLEPKTIGGLQ